MKNFKKIILLTLVMTISSTSCTFTKNSSINSTPTNTAVETENSTYDLPEISEEDYIKIYAESHNLTIDKAKEEVKI